MSPRITRNKILLSCAVVGMVVVLTFAVMLVRIVENSDHKSQLRNRQFDNLQQVACALLLRPGVTDGPKYAHQLDCPNPGMVPASPHP